MMKNYTVILQPNKMVHVFNEKKADIIELSYKKCWDDSIILSDEAEQLPKYVQNYIKKEAKKELN